MIDKRKLSVNAISSVIQLIVSGCVLFYLYRFLLDTIGIELLGVWSLILATSSVMRGANLGLAGSIVKQVADYSACGEEAKLSQVVQTSVITVAVFFETAALKGLSKILSALPAIRFTL